METENGNAAVVCRVARPEVAQDRYPSPPAIVDLARMKDQRAQLALLDDKSRMSGERVRSDLTLRLRDLQARTPKIIAKSAAVSTALSHAVNIDIGSVIIPIACVIADALAPGASESYQQLQHFHFLCGNCGKAIGAHLIWNCGYCNHSNTQINGVADGSFLNRCSNCHYAPDGFVCPYCYYLIAFSTTSTREHAACCVDRFPPPPLLPVGTPPPSAKETKALTVAAHQDEIERIEQEIELTELKTKLARAKAALSAVEGHMTGTLNREIEQIVTSLTERHLKRKAMVEFQKKASDDINGGVDLADEVKEVLRGELEADVQGVLLSELDV